MQSRLILALPALLALACDPFSNLPSNDWYELDDALWSDDVVAAGDGVYVRLPYAGELVYVRDGERYGVVDLDGGEPTRLVAKPDGSGVLVFDRWQVCDDPDPKIELVSDCDDADLGWETELSIVEEGKRIGIARTPGTMNALAFSDDGGTAVAYLDYSLGDDIQIEGIVDLNEVVFIDLATGDTQAVSVGFSPDTILFSLDNTRAVVLSRSQVVAVDLETFEIQVTYPLTLDADQEIDPAGATITPDGRYLLIAIEGSSDLYVLDLDVEAIDIKELDAPPSALATETIPDDGDSLDVTLMVYGNIPQLDIMDNVYFDIDSVELDEPKTGILVGDDFVVLYNDRTTGTYKDVDMVDLTTMARDEYVMGNPVASLELTSDGRFAFGVLRPENSSGGLEGEQDTRWGVAVIDLAEGKEKSLVTQSEPVGLAVVEGDEATYGLVLLQGYDKLIQMDLENPTAYTEIDLLAPPSGIGSMPDGRFYITHDANLGLVSFLDPATGELDSTHGFATIGMLQDDTLPRRDEEEN